MSLRHIVYFFSVMVKGECCRAGVGLQKRITMSLRYIVDASEASLQTLYKKK